MAINSIQSSLLRGNGAVDSPVPPKSAPLPIGGRRDAPVAEVDQVRLTPETVRLRQHMDSLEKGPPMNESKIKALQKAIAEGAYQVNSERLAGKILDFETPLV